MGTYDIYIGIGIAVGTGFCIGIVLLLFKLGIIIIRYIEDGAQQPPYQLMEHPDNMILPVSPPSYSPIPSSSIHSPSYKNVIQSYIRVSVVLSKSLCRREMEKMISNLDSAVSFSNYYNLEFRKFSNNIFFQSLLESSGTIF
jgi:hypothetical protein